MKDENRALTVPNVICGLRLLGSAPLLWLAHEGHREGFLWLFVLLLASDWIDGKLAVRLEQESTFGARFDSVADAILYLALGISCWWLEEEAIRRGWGWFAAVGATWLLSAFVSLARFRKMPSYHTRGAKVSWLIAGSAAIHWILTGRPTFVPWALAVVTLTNLEAMAIGAVLPRWRANVPSIVHALRVRRRAAEEEAR